MKYFWSSEVNEGSFMYWEVEDNEEAMKHFEAQLKEIYGNKYYQYGETVRGTYVRNNK